MYVGRLRQMPDANNFTLWFGAYKVPVVLLPADTIVPS